MLLAAISCVACAGSLPGVNADGSAAAPGPSGAELLRMADMLADGGDEVRAGQYLVAAQARGVPDRQVIGRLLKLDAAGGQYRLGIEHAEGYLQSHPSDAGVHQCLASFYLAIGATAEAAREYTRVLEQRPDNAEAHFALATLLRDAGIERGRTDVHYRAYIALAPHGRHADEARAGLLQELP
jgi:tetratricopeptide (TPR) repeat protein